MVLNYIWIAFFLIAFVVALCKLVIGGDTEVFTHIINASFASAKTGFEISLGLTGVLALWLWHHENRGKRRRDTGVCPADGACIQQALSGNTERPSGYGLHLHVPFGKLVRLGQCSYTDGTESHERVAGTECEEGVRQRSDDHVPLYQRFGTDTDSCLHHDLPGTDGSSQPSRCLPAPYARDLLFHPGGHIGGLFQATNQHSTTEPIAFLRRHDHVRRWPGLAFRDDEPAIGLPLLYPVCQHFTFLHHMRIHHQRYSQENQRIRHFYRRSERRFPDRRNDHPLPHRRPGRLPFSELQEQWIS